MKGDSGEDGLPGRKGEPGDNGLPGADVSIYNTVQLDIFEGFIFRCLHRYMKIAPSTFC